MNKNSTAYIALGSNLQNPIEQLKSAIDEINNHQSIEAIDTSRFYQTKPIGPDQPDIINAVIQITTTLKPHDLLKVLQQIELNHNRVRTIRFGARTLDLDILLYDNVRINDDVLTIPHPRMHKRNFVLIPLRDITENIPITNFGLIDDLIAKNDPEDYVIPL